MTKRYLLDTNAYFKYLSVVQEGEGTQFADVITTIKEGNPCVSAVTKVEIISVLGKYARGNSGGQQQCNCIISPDGQQCTNTRYVTPRKRWKNKRVKAWKKLIEETLSGESSLITLELIPFDLATIEIAQKIIDHALVLSFASMDALIAATAKQVTTEDCEVVVVTADKSLKACLQKCGIPFWDAFNPQSA